MPVVYSITRVNLHRATWIWARWLGFCSYYLEIILVLIPCSLSVPSSFFFPRTVMTPLPNSGSTLFVFQVTLGLREVI